MSLSTSMPRRRAAHSPADAAVVGIALFSTNPAALADFYARVLGTSFEHRAHDDGRAHWIARMGGVHFEVKALVTSEGTPTADAHASGEQAVGMGRAELSFRVDDVPAAVSRVVEHGGATLQDPGEFAWGTFAVVLDPDGNRLGLFEPPADDSNSDMEARA